MKTRIVVCLLLVVMLVAGWKSFLTKEETPPSMYDINVEQADAWMKEGLYQRAILKYKEAIEEKSLEETWTKLLKAYDARLAEDSELIEEFITTMSQAVELFPENEEFTIRLAELYRIDGKALVACQFLEDVIAKGYETDRIHTLLKTIRYKVIVSDTQFIDFGSYRDETYTVQQDDDWYVITAKGSMEIGRHAYISSSGDQGTRVYTTVEENVGESELQTEQITRKADSRLITEENFVLGIFDFEVSKAGIYSCGLIPIAKDNSWAYYDEFAKKAFGDYDVASTFQDDVAVVKKDDKWALIGTDGKVMESSEYTDIILDRDGNYINGERIIAADEKGLYHLYDLEWNQIGDFTCDMADTGKSDGIIAVKQSGKWGFVDQDGEQVIEAKYENAKSFSNGLAAVCKDGMWGFINMEDELIVPYQFLGIDYVNDCGTFMVKKNKMTENNGIEVMEERWELLQFEVFY